MALAEPQEKISIPETTVDVNTALRVFLLSLPVDTQREMCEALLQNLQKQDDAIVPAILRNVPGNHTPPRQVVSLADAFKNLHGNPLWKDIREAIEEERAKDRADLATLQDED
jgi:hypothetical protein